MENSNHESVKDDENTTEKQSESAYSFDVSRLSLFVNQRSQSSKEKRDSSSKSEEKEAKKTKVPFFSPLKQLGKAKFERSGESINVTNKQWGQASQKEAKTMCKR